MTRIKCLMVDDEEALRVGYAENIKIALRQSSNIDAEIVYADSVEEGKTRLPESQTEFDVVIVDLVWGQVGSRRGGRSSDRGLEVVRQAAKTPGVVIVAISVGDTTHFPFLEDDARKDGAQIFRIRGALQAGSRSGGWDRLAQEISEHLGGEAGPTRKMPKGKAMSSDSIFVVCGRHKGLVAGLFAFLRALGLKPWEWEELVTLSAAERGTGGNPSILDVVEFGFSVSHGAIVLFSPDDEARLKTEHRDASDPAWEGRLTAQPRPNVLLEAGYALAFRPSRTLIVSSAHLRPVSDLGGRHLIYLDNSMKCRKGIAERLRAMSFSVRTAGDGWLTEGDLAG
jgi:predicted nucleotide-binding protein